MISSGVAMVVNIILNYILIYGKFGFPAMGIRGAAYGTGHRKYEQYRSFLLPRISRQISGKSIP
jgi:hypothetical protein